ncbi:MAG: sulfatase-like hydrolase/transferase [Planctomycetota bacterium]|jgi:uncharacterized sulfatase
MSRRAARPNVLFLFTDQQRWDTVGAYGQRLDVTPHLDRMASEGVLFRRAFTCQPVCGPARSCLQTGKYATETGCFRNHIALPLDEETIAHRLSAVGYEVGYIGKWHLASTGGPGLPAGRPEANYRTEPVPPERRGGYKDFWLASDVLEFTSHSYDGHMFDGEMNRVEFPEGRYRADCVTDFALDYLRRREGGRPFFLFVSYIEPHYQNDHNRFEGPRGSGERFGNYEVPGDLVGTEGDWRENYPDYLGCCHSLDENLGRLRAELDALGIAEETLVIFTSDHGCHFRTRNGEYKRSCHEGSIRIPLVACGPGFCGGRTVEELAGLIDLPRTVLTAAGAEAPPGMRGHALQDLLNGGAEDWRQEVFVQISESHVGRALRTERWKYSVRAPGKDGAGEPASERYVEDFLYDLEADPYERDNLVADPARESVRTELRERLKRRMVEAGEEEPVIEPTSG